MYKRFRNKTIVITGADTDIGKATAIRFAKEDANLVLVGNDKQALIDAHEQLPDDLSWLHENHCLTITCDIASHEQVEKMIAIVKNEYEHIDVLINHVNIDKNLDDNCYISEAFVPHLKQSNGNIVHLSPRLENKNDRELTLFTRRVANKYCADGVRVNKVSFPTKTKAITQMLMANKEKKRFRKEKKDKKQHHQSLLRAVNFDDVIDAITFMASDEASMITGVNLPVDGGSRLAD